MFEKTEVCAETRIEDAQEGVVACEPPRKGVAIVGFGSNTRGLAPYNDPRFEIWGLNQGHFFMPRRADRWFEMHRPEYTPDMRDPDYAKFLAELRIPVYALDVRPDIPWSVRFPIERLIDKFGGLDYYTSTVAYMIALAIDEGFHEIHCYGVDLTTDEEYAFQRPCVEWWLGTAYGRGINVYTPKESALLKQPWRYGYDIAQPFGGIDPAVIERDIEMYEQNAKRLVGEYHMARGAAQYAQHVRGLVEAANRGTVVTTPR